MESLEDDDGPVEGEAPDIVAVVKILGVVEQRFERVETREPGSLVAIRYDGAVLGHFSKIELESAIL